MAVRKVETEAGTAYTNGAETIEVHDDQVAAIDAVEGDAAKWAAVLAARQVNRTGTAEDQGVVLDEDRTENETDRERDTGQR